MNVRMEITIFYMDVCLICPELFPSTILLMFPEIFIQFSSQKAADSFFTEQLTTEPRWTSVPGSVPHWRGVTALHWQYSHPRMLNQTYSVKHTCKLMKCPLEYFGPMMATYLLRWINNDIFEQWETKLARHRLLIFFIFPFQEHI